MMFQVTNLFVYKFAFMAAVLVAENLFLFRLKKQRHFVLRLVLCTLFCFLFVAAYPLLQYNALYSSVMFTVFFALTLVAAKICYDISWKNCIFCTVAGYSIQHLASVCFDVVMTLGGFDRSQPYSNETAGFSLVTVLIFIQVYALVYWCLFNLFGNKIQRDEDLAIKSPALLALIVVTVLVEIVLNAFVIYEKYENLNLTYYMAASVSNIICSVLVLVIQFSLLLSKTLRDELDIVYHMWHQEKKQYQLSKETIDLINMKCHDMKYQIHNISKANAIDAKALDEIKETISIYDSIVETGNKALDIILAEKSLHCQKNGIFISYMIDGEKLDFMNDADIYSLFGNLLDNAIETVIKLEPDKRVIGLTIKAEGKLLSVNAHNYYDGDVRMEGGIPVTSKDDKDYHGFGVKSMVMIVEKYGGNISFEAKDQVFNVNILFPL